jgi:hypothetical protein
VTSGGDSSSYSSSHDNDTPTTHELLFENRSVSVALLVLCFCWTLLSVLAPSLLMRHEQFSRLQVVSLGIWHAFAAGVLLAAAWMLFLPNMLTVAGMMHLPSPSLPFVLLFCSMLVPLALDKVMLWLCTRKADAPVIADISSEWAGTPRVGGYGPPSATRAAAAPGADDRSTSQPSTPRHSMTPQQLPASASRKSSAAIGSGGGAGGYQADAALYDERKTAHGRTASRSGVPPLSGSRAQQAAVAAMHGYAGAPEEGFGGGQPLSGNDIESAPLLTPRGTPRGSVTSLPSSTPTRTAGAGGWYSSAAARAVDASEFKMRQSYIGRCAMCKENITTGKGVAFHGAGCGLRSFHAFSFSSRWMQGLRGQRSLQRDIVMHDEAAAGADAALGGPPQAVGWSLAAYVLVLSVYNLCLAGGVNLQEAAHLYSRAREAASAGIEDAAHDSWVGEVCRASLVALVMFCFTAFYGFSLGLMLALHRVSLKSPRALGAMLLYALSLPGAIALNYFFSSYASASVGPRIYGLYLLVCQCFCVGILLYASFLDLLLEEWARAEAIVGKYIGFAVGAAIVIAITIWAS